MVLRAINGVPADRLAFTALQELTDGDIRGLTLTFQRDQLLGDAVAVLPQRPSRTVFDADGPPSIPGGGAVHCDDSSGDDIEQGIVKVKLGAEDHGQLGIEFKPVCIRSFNPAGMGQFRAGRPLEVGMELSQVNGVPVSRLAYNA